MQLCATHARAPVPSPFGAGWTPAQAASDEEEDMLRRLNGHCYSGHKHDLQPHGEGEYVFRNGTVYRGSFSGGVFHGRGVLTYPDGSRFSGTWVEGRLEGGVYHFADGLEYSARDWQYCTDADRRFWSETQSGIQFESRPQLTDSGERDTESLPLGCYDLGDCFLDPRDDKLYNYDGTYYREPTPEELAWAKRKTRIGLDRREEAQRRVEEAAIEAAAAGLWKSSSSKAAN